MATQPAVFNSALPGRPPDADEDSRARVREFFAAVAEEDPGELRRLLHFFAKSFDIPVDDKPCIGSTSARKARAATKAG